MPPRHESGNAHRRRQIKGVSHRGPTPVLVAHSALGEHPQEPRHLSDRSGEDQVYGRQNDAGPSIISRSVRTIPEASMCAQALTKVRHAPTSRLGSLGCCRRSGEWDLRAGGKPPRVVRTEYFWAYHPRLTRSFLVSRRPISRLACVPGRDG